MPSKAFLVPEDLWSRVAEQEGGAMPKTNVRRVSILYPSTSCPCCRQGPPRSVNDVEFRYVPGKLWRKLAKRYGNDGTISAANGELSDGRSRTKASQAKHREQPQQLQAPPNRRKKHMQPPDVEQWRVGLKEGDEIDARDTNRNWYEARVTYMDDLQALIHYVGWNARFDEWIDITSQRLMPRGWKTAKSGD